MPNKERISVESDYSKVLDFVDASDALWHSVMMAVQKSVSRKPLIYLQVTLKLMREFDPLVDKVPGYLKSYIEESVAPDDRTHPFFRIIISDNSTEELAWQLVQQQQFTKSRIKSLIELSEHKKKVLVTGEIKALFAIILAGAGFFLQFVPEPFIKWLGLDYDQYRIVVFILLCFILLILALMLIFFWVTYRRAAQRHERAEVILKYCGMLLEDEGNNTS